MKVISYNLRGDFDPSPRTWAERSPLAERFIEESDADLIGVQEVHHAHEATLTEAFKDKYHIFFTFREEGIEKPEGIGVFVRKSRFEIIKQGSFMLSETPDKLGSLGWDADCPRITSFMVLEDNVSGKVFVFANTHFDHVGVEARTKSAQMLSDFIVEYKEQGLDTILTGDFNVHPGSGMVDALSQNPLLINTWQVISKGDVMNSSTFHRFEGTVEGTPIDHIFATKPFEMKEVIIERANYDGEYPSDHYPVTAIFLSSN